MSGSKLRRFTRRRKLCGAKCEAAIEIGGPLHGGRFLAAISGAANCGAPVLIFKWCACFPAKPCECGATDGDVNVSL